MAGRRGDFADIDFGVEIGGEGLTVIAAIAIKNIKRADRL
jgi:hypothetical protein